MLGVRKNQESLLPVDSVLTFPALVRVGAIVDVVKGSPNRDNAAFWIWENFPGSLSIRNFDEQRYKRQMA